MKDQIEVNGVQVPVYRQDLIDVVGCAISPLNSFAGIVGMIESCAHCVDTDRVEDIVEVLHEQAAIELKTLVDAIERKLGGPVVCLRVRGEARRVGVRKDDVLDIEVKAEEQAA